MNGSDPEYLKPYLDAVASSGAGFDATLWSSREGQQRRFHMLATLAGLEGDEPGVIVDLGCGVGTTLRALGREFPGARLQGVERSDYLCGRYGWTPGSVEDYRDGRPYDLVVCHDVLGYLDDAACARAIGNIADLCRGAAYVSVITADDAGAYDADRTDAAQTLRPAAWYRRRLARHFLHVGGGLHLKKPVDTVVWALERA